MKTPHFTYQTLSQTGKSLKSAKNGFTKADFKIKKEHPL